MKLCDRIKECRKSAGLSQDKLAEWIGVSRQAVTKWETGQSAPSTENLLKLAEIFGTTVDQLIAADDSPKQLTAAEIYRFYKLEEEKEASEKRMQQEKNLIAAGCILGIHLLLYLFLQLISHDLNNSTISEILFGKNSHLYLWSWLLYTKLFWAALCIAVISVLLGKWRFAATTSIMFFLGILVGELFGPYPAGNAYGHNHYGWAIWAGIYLVALIMGAIAQKMKTRGIAYKSKQSAVWFAVTVGCCIAVLLFIMLSRPDFTMEISQ